MLVCVFDHLAETTFGSGSLGVSAFGHGASRGQVLQFRIKVSVRRVEFTCFCTSLLGQVPVVGFTAQSHQFDPPLFRSLPTEVHLENGVGVMVGPGFGVKRQSLAHEFEGDFDVAQISEPCVIRTGKFAIGPHALNLFFLG